MEQRLMHLVLFSVILCESRSLTEYVLIREHKTWNEAQEFCRQNYIELVTVQTNEEWNELNKVRANYLAYTWIGLYDDVNSWRWSFGDERPTYTRWDQDQPDNFGADQDCVMLHENGYWRDKGCNLRCLVTCQSDHGPVATNKTMPWKQAQSFCRENFIDLYTVKNESENQLLRMITSNNDSCIWIGLFRDAWKWSDQTNTSASLRWAQKQPDNNFGSEICAAVDESGWIVDEQCSMKFFFVCKSPIPVKRQILRLEVKAGDNISINVIANAMLKEVQQKLQKQGMAADVKLSWREQPNGLVFQTINKDHHR